VLRGSPSAFDGLGRNVPDEVQVNDYGGQLYLFDPGTGDARPLTRDFDPDVNAVWWSPADGRIYALATNRQDRNLFALEPDDTRDGTPDWRAVPTGLEYTDDAAFARDERVALVWGSSAAQPPRLQALDLAHGRARPLLDPGTTWYHDVGFGEVSDWPCSLPSGEVLDGRIYYPADFDPQQRYPLIVYYYGGTVPVTRDYGGRYPKNVWAAHGYVVYVPEPSGATGYGQEFAARHVNDWGRITAREVIAATKAFLATHAFVDPERVGCIGASYGGFLTELIVTETDLFTCAISHAGISSISSYWGEGLWGYVYGARALAGSFPWQDRELYVEQSPLFHADRITTPLLLLHGTADTNVPMGESDQLFTALRLLGRDVEYVQIVGQNHHILDHDQRIVWNDTILAYFAKYLKRQPAWWNHLYPKESE
jgi:dipeptidyl aminopeptidase/acylaminoacyl peptidase